MLALVIPEARDLIFATLERARLIPTLEYFFARDTRPLLLAGAVRDALLSIELGRPTRSPRDLDIGVHCASQRRFHRMLRQLGGIPNRHGGYKLVLNGQALDIWRLQDTVGIRFHRAPYSLTNVLRSFVIDLNAAAFDPDTGVFYEGGTLRAVRTRQIHFAEGALLHSAPTFAAKALLAAIRFGIPLSSELHRFTCQFIDSHTLSHEWAKVFTERPVHTRSPALGCERPILTDPSQSCLSVTTPLAPQRP